MATILAVGFIGKDAQEALETYGGFVQTVSAVPSINLVFLPHRSDVGQIEGQECIITFPGNGGSVVLNYSRHLDITQSTIFIEEYPDIVA